MELRSGTFPKVHTILSGLAVTVGVLMLIAIIPIEDEPTAIPLVLIGSGIGWCIATRRRNDPTPKSTVRIAVGMIGTIVARSRPREMARTLFAMALTQTIVFAIALIVRLGEPWSGPLELLGLNGFFVAQYVGSALLFRRVEAARSSVA